MPSSTDSPPPDEGGLQQAALSYLARYAATEAGLRRVLIRQVDRWAREQGDPEAAQAGMANARAAVEQVVARLVQAGAVTAANYEGIWPIDHDTAAWPDDPHRYAAAGMPRCRLHWASCAHPQT